MKTVTINKTWNEESAPQTFSYAADAPMGHIKRHLASEVSYARKGLTSIMNPTNGKIPLQVALVEATGLTAKESEDLKQFLANI